MKSVLVFLLMALAVSAEIKATCKPESQHFLEDSLGDACSNTHDPKYRLQVKRDLIVDGSLLQVKTREMKIPQTGTLDRIIQCVRVTNNVLNEHGGCPSISDGGAGKNFVNIHFVSQRSREMNFHVEVYVLA